ncbi:hypothetical protein [Mucilaginibacter aquatilis]|uniref:Uncharacterized protein n=1 Tax=Mucilaginibacter aquatilis TaxID=1517760 RepID=A0A6I4IBF2_9SPHI|nr:hypothetical protein [Mucilaginibacter aquatilis]MVN92580.1 hypothetical protein [Mucilaginibacter aquatilis]
MKKLLLILVVTFIFSKDQLLAQKSGNLDTVYYLVDTLNTPIHDRMWDVGLENPIYYYSLHCNCYPENTNPTFGYNVKQIGKTITKSELVKMKTINLKQLIDIVTQFGIDRNRKYVFYFIEAVNEKYIINQVVLPEYRKRVPTN